MLDNSQIERVQTIVENACTLIVEHVESVQVVVTIHSEDWDSSRSITCGRGSLYARLGAVREWLLMQDEYIRDHARKTADE